MIESSRFRRVLGVSSPVTLGLALVSIVALALAALTACAPPQPPAPAAPDFAAMEKALMDADRAFAAAVAAAAPENRAQAWAAWFAADGVQLYGGEINRGHDAVTALMQPSFAQGFVLEWEPEFVVAAASGDLGYTIGRYTSRMPLEDGTERPGSGRYLTVWAKQPDGSWKVAVDLGSPAAASS